MRASESEVFKADCQENSFSAVEPLYKGEVLTLFTYFFLFINKGNHLLLPSHLQY